ncbi:MAG TPA: twin-arginine translocase TatA/TatE family subunit [Rhodospirillaceae bacterium]|jgi:sec-independent protein translocase protein TatA|nr:twin-arginine translocase TatA/TatE family subunit [Alphaproteobacteria bacterium]HBH26269.1 twin-arginine translocase TatA/TatE family subunit [Rhodospirillaceae bacterium]
MFPGPLQIALVIVLVLVLFGAGRVPDIMRNIARGARAFKKGLEDDPKDEDKR